MPEHDEKDPTYTRLVNLQKSLLARRAQALRQIEQFDEQLRSVSVTLSLLGIKDEELHGIVVPNVKGCTQLEALIRIARANGNRITMTDAKRIMVREGMVKTPKNAGAILFNVITKSEKFNRVAPGVYELLPEPEETKPLLVNVSGSLNR